MSVRNLIPALCLLLVACGDWPEVDVPAMSRSGSSWPELVPLETVSEASTTEDTDPAAAARALARRAAALRRRAAILRRPVEDADAFDALREAIRTACPGSVAPCPATG